MIVLTYILECVSNSVVVNNPYPYQIKTRSLRLLFDRHDQSNRCSIYAPHPTKAMERDIDTNFWQHGAQKLRKMAELFRSLAPDQRLVELPQ